MTVYIDHPRFGDVWQKVEFEGFCHSPEWTAWLNIGGKRDKLYIGRCFPVNEHNTELVREIKRLEIDIELLQYRKKKIAQQLQPLEA